MIVGYGPAVSDEVTEHEPLDEDELLELVDVVEAAASSVDVFLQECASGAMATNPNAVKPFFKNDFLSMLIIV